MCCFSSLCVGWTSKDYLCVCMCVSFPCNCSFMFFMTLLPFFLLHHTVLLLQCSQSDGFCMFCFHAFSACVSSFFMFLPVCLLGKFITSRFIPGTFEMIVIWDILRDSKGVSYGGYPKGPPHHLNILMDLTRAPRCFTCSYNLGCACQPCEPPTFSGWNPPLWALPY